MSEIMTLDIKTEGEKARQEYQPLVEKAQEAAKAIVDDATFEAAGVLYQDIKKKIKNVGTVLDPFVDKAHKAWKDAIAERAKYLDPLEDAANALKPALGRYQEEQIRKQQEEQRRLEEANRKAAEEAQLAEAQAAEAAGDKEAAEAIISRPTVTAPVVAPVQAKKVPGLSSREVWSSKVVDLKALLKGVLDGSVPMAAVIANQTFLDGQARQLKAELKYPGVLVQKTVSPVSR